jgi:hypothetical protein
VLYTIVRTLQNLLIVILVIIHLFLNLQTGAQIILIRTKRHVTCGLKARIMEPEETSIVKLQVKPANSYARNNRRAVGGGVFSGIRPVIIYREPNWSFKGLSR